MGKRKPNPAICLLSLLLILQLSSIAQTEQTLMIVDPGEIYSTFNFNATNRDALIQAIGQEKFTKIDQACREDKWPEGIASLDLRTSNRESMKDYNVLLVAVFEDKSIIEVNAADNTHMPSNMLSDHPFYFIIGSRGLGSGNDTTAMGEEKVTGYDDGTYYPMVEIVDPAALLPNYEFSKEEVEDIINQVGAEGFDFITAHCRENVWPEAINTPEERLKAADEIPYYITFLVAETGDISILEVTPEENLLMQEDFVPEDVIYFIIRSDGIEILD